MRSCDEALELISAALDGALTDEEQAALDEHLSHCPACSALFDELSGLHAAAAELDEIPAPAGFADQVMARIAADPAQDQAGNVVAFPAKKRSRNPWKGWAATAAVVAVVALGAVTLPGQLGAGSKNASSGAAADCAAPAQAAAQADSAYADFPAENELSEPFAWAPVPEVNGATRIDTGDAAAQPETAFDGLPAEVDGSSEAQENDTAKNTSQPFSSESSAVYCGVLTLTGESLPEGLENYDVTESESGSLAYVVPADYFFSCLTQLQDQNAANFTYDASGGQTAEYGLIIVTVPAGP